jgi:hypothetical protein
MSDTSRKQTIMAELNQETSKIYWSDMQKFFAAGATYFVDETLDLLETVADIAMDNKAQLETWMAENKVNAVPDEMATRWLAEDIMVWAVVLAPYVFVQRVQEK